MNTDVLAKYIGKHVEIAWDGGSMEGRLERIDEQGWAMLDWGYGIEVKNIMRIQEITPTTP